MEIKITNANLDAPENTVDEQLSLKFIYPALLDFKKLRTSVPVASNIVKSIKEVERAIKEFTDIRISICESVCEKDDKGNAKIENGRYKFTEEEQKEFFAKFRELLSTEISINIFPVNYSDILSVKNVNIEAYDTLSKHGFIKEEAHSLNGKANAKELLEIK